MKRVRIHSDPESLDTELGSCPALCSSRSRPESPHSGPGVARMPGSSQWRLGHLGSYFRGKERISSALPAGSKTHLLRRPGEDPLARYRARSGREVPAQSISEIVEKTGTLGDSYWTPISKVIVLLAKWAFPPTWRVLECGQRVWKRQNNPPRHLRYPKLLAAGAGLSSCSPPHVPL